MTYNRPRAGRRLAALVLLGVLLLAACGSSKKSDDAVGAGSAEKESETPTTVGAQTVSVDQSFHNAGFEVTLGDATLAAGDGGLGSNPLEVEIEATFANEGTDTASFSEVDVALASARENYLPVTQADSLPDVPGGTTGKGSFTFAVEDSFTFDDAVLTFGSAENTQSVIPLGSKGTLVTNDPIDIPAPGSATVGEITVTMTGGQVRFDDPINHRGVAKGHVLVVVDLDVTRAGGQIDTTFIGTENLALRLPDGTTVAIVADGVSNPTELLSPNATLKDLQARFEGDNPYAGAYALIVKSTVGNQPVQSEIPFTVTAPTEASGSSSTTSTTS